MTLANFTVRESILEDMLKNTTKNIGDVHGKSVIVYLLYCQAHATPIIMSNMSVCLFL